MIVRHFLQWVRTAPAGERAEATSALARAYLYSDLSPDDLAAAEGAMLMLLDDPSPLVRRALADALAASPDAPPAIMLALAADQPSIAAPVLSAVAAARRCRSGRCRGDRRAGGPGRDRQPRRAAALGRRRDRRSRHRRSLPDAGRKSRRRHRAVLDRPHRRALRPSRRDPRGAAGARRSCRRRRARRWSPNCRETLAGFVAGARLARPTITPSASRGRPARRRPSRSPPTAPRREVRPLIRHLRESGQLTAGLILRALLSGNIVLFEEALAELAGMPVARVSA